MVLQGISFTAEVSASIAAFANHPEAFTYSLCLISLESASVLLDVLEEANQHWPCRCCATYLPLQEV